MLSKPCLPAACKNRTDLSADPPPIWALSEIQRFSSILRQNAGLDSIAEAVEILNEDPLGYLRVTGDNAALRWKDIIDPVHTIPWDRNTKTEKNSENFDFEKFSERNFQNSKNFLPSKALLFILIERSPQNGQDVPKKNRKKFGDQ